MFGSKQTPKDMAKELSDLQWTVDRLQHKLQETRDDYLSSLRILRKHVAQLAQGEQVSAEAILQGTPYRTISAEMLDDYLAQHPGAILLDVRTDQEWDAGHIAGAMHIEVNQLPQRLAQLPDTNQEVVAICARGGRSAAACEILFEQGYHNLVNVSGGMMDYPGETAIGTIEPLSIEGLPGDVDLLKRVAVFLDSQVRPQLKRDGGDIRLLGITPEQVVQVTMIGACGGCGVRSSTVNEGIQQALLAAIPELTGIQDH